MTNPRDRLIDHLPALRGDISKSTTQRLMALLRELLEERKERKKYSALTMYCDWSVHTKLDRSPAGSALLDILDIWASSTTVDEQVQVLGGELSVLKLRKQIEELLESSFIHPSVILDDHAFASIVDHFIADLVAKPISRRSADVSKRTSERLAKGLRHIADQLFFSLGDGKASAAKYVLNLVSKQIDPPRPGTATIVLPWPIAVNTAGEILF